MRSLILFCACLLSLSVSAATDLGSGGRLFNDLKGTSWEGSFHFKVYRKIFSNERILTRTSETYTIKVQFPETGLTNDQMVPYYFTKDTSMATGQDALVFKYIDVQACAGEPRHIEVFNESYDGSYGGVVHAPDCRKGKRTVQQLHVKSIKRDGDRLQIVIDEKAIDELVTFEIIYDLTKTN